MYFDSPVTLFALAIPPLVTLVFLVFFWLRRQPLNQPSIVIVLPFGLTAITILLGQSAILTISAFKQIATQKTAGVFELTNALRSAQQPITAGMVDVAVCLLLILISAFILKIIGDDDQPMLHAYISLPALIATGVVIISVLLLAYFQYNTVDMIMVVIDPRRYHELASNGNLPGVDAYAARISMRLILITALSVVLFIASLVAGILNIFWRQKESARENFAMVLAIATLAGCGLSLLEGFNFTNYLNNLY